MAANPLEIAARIAEQIVQPPPRRTPSQWTDANRVLPDDSPEPGPFRVARTPYIVEVMDCAADPSVRRITLVCGSQMGKSEMPLNVLGWRFVDGPRVPALYVGPTRTQVRTFSKTRVDPMIEQCESLKAIMATGLADSIMEKWLGGSPFAFAWAGSKTELASRPCGLVIIDELDRMPVDVGGEGDPVTLAEARTKNYYNKLIVVTSTPTVQGSSACWTLLEEGSLEFWAWPCKHCGEMFVPHLALLRWPDKATPEQAHDAARVVCPHCGGEHESADQRALNHWGRFIQHRVMTDVERSQPPPWSVMQEYVPDDDPKPTTDRSFWVSGLASPWMTFGELAARLVRAYRSHDQNRIMATVNTYGGELYTMSGEAKPWELVAALKSDYEPGTTPDGVQLVTMGVDVQRDGLWYMICGWGYNLGGWILQNEFLTGSPEYDEVWVKLSTILSRPVGKTGMGILGCLVDSGWKPGDAYRRPEHMVYKFARRHAGQVWPAKGRAQMNTPFLVNTIEREVDGRNVPIELVSHDTDHFKSLINARLDWPKNDAGAWHTHREFSEADCKQIVAEQLIKLPSGKRKWDAGKRPNHLLDCLVLALVQATRVNAGTSLPTWEQYKARLAQAEQQAKNPQIRPQSFVKRPQGSFFRR